VAVVRPFRPLRPVPEKAALVASVPYDVCSTAEARALAAGNADSFLHVTRAEIEFGDDVDAHSDAVYQRGAANLKALEERGVLVREEQPCLYLYRQIMGDHAQTGLVGAFSVEEYDTSEIVKHEHTRPGKEQDRTTHVLTLDAMAGPVFLTYRPSGEVDALVKAIQAGDPLFDFSAVDGIQHTVWRVDDPAPFVEAFGRIHPLYIADGHHRSAAASNVRKQKRADGVLTAEHPAQHFLAVAFPSDQVQILPYNRLIHDLGGRTPEAFLRAVEEIAGAEPTSDASPAGPDEVRMYVAGGWHRVPLTPSVDTPVGRLAVQMLQDRVLGPLLDITDPRTDERLSFVGGIRGTGELQARVEAGEALVAFSLPAVTPGQLLEVSDAGLTMPPKSTWFEPKLRSGLLTYPLSPPASSANLRLRSN